MAEHDSDVLIAGDGPAGLSAALLLAKNGLQVDVVGPNRTPTHKALLLNYLGAPKMPGDRFMDTAREQVREVGARLHHGEVERAEGSEGAFRIHTPTGDTFRARYLVLTNGPDTTLAKALHLELQDQRVHVDRNGRTSVDGIYAGGWLVRGAKIQAAIAVGDGAAIALDILSKEKGKPFHDFDTQ